MWWSYLAHGVPGGVGRYMADLPSTYYTHAAEVLRHAAGLPSMASIRRAKKRKIQIAKRRAENEAKAKVWPHRSQTRRRVSCWLTITTRVQADAEAIAAAEAAAARAAAIDRGEAVPEDQPASKPDETPAADGEAGGGDTRAAAQDEPPAAVVSISDDEEEQQRQLMDMFPDPVKRALYVPRVAAMHATGRLTHCAAPLVVVQCRGETEARKGGGGRASSARARRRVGGHAGAKGVPRCHDATRTGTVLMQRNPGVRCRTVSVLTVVVWWLCLCSAMVSGGGARQV